MSVLKSERLLTKFNFRFLFFRRIKNWIYEKKQDVKPANRHGNGNGKGDRRRLRQKSVGDIPTNSSPLQNVQNQSVPKNRQQMQAYPLFTQVNIRTWQNLKKNI